MKLVAATFAGILLAACAESPKAARTDSAPPVLPSAAPVVPLASAKVTSASPAASAETAPPPPCASADSHRTVPSPDGHVTAFVAFDPSKTIATTTEDVPHEDLCLAKDGGAPKVLVAGHAAGPNEGVERTLASFGNLVFSTDGALLFFTSAAWATSGAAHVVEIATGKEKFLFDGEVAAPIVTGKDKGHYLASHFRLDEAHPISSPQYRGRVVSWSVVSKDGKTIRKLGDAEAKRIARDDVAPSPN